MHKSEAFGVGIFDGEAVLSAIVIPRKCRFRAPQVFYGCEAPLIELKIIAGIPNPETSVGDIWYDCIKRCVPPKKMNYVGPVRCKVYKP